MQTATLRSGVAAETTQASEAALALLTHWPEYLIELAALATFMISACIFGVLLEHPLSPFNHAIESADLRRATIGAAMGLTAIGIFCSPWGQRSGAHMNPAVTLSFLSLGKVKMWDAVFYVVAQFTGGIVGVGLSSLLLGAPVRHSAVNYVATVPGASDAATTFAAEFLISFLMMTTVLVASNSRRFRWFTPFLAGTLFSTFIAFEAPLSGMSMNPARTFGSAIWAHEWTGLWIYFLAPVAGMLTAALAYRARRGAHRVFCAKILHGERQRCIFRCEYPKLARARWQR